MKYEVNKEDNIKLYDDFGKDVLKLVEKYTGLKREKTICEKCVIKCEVNEPPEIEIRILPYVKESD